MSEDIPTLSEALATPGEHEVVVEAWVRVDGKVQYYNSFRVLVHPDEIRKVRWERSILETGAHLNVPYNRADISGWVAGEWKLLATWNLESGITWL